MSTSNLAIHEAVERGDMGEVLRILERDPSQDIDARGVDAGRPLHFCRCVELAELLIERGAELDARDEDHDSTAAQWRIGDAPAVARFLIERGATPDIFLAAALDDLELARRVLEQEPESTSYRIGHDSGPFPGIGYQGRGGTILQWSLGFNRSPHEVAIERGHRELYDFLWERTHPPTSG